MSNDIEFEQNTICDKCQTLKNKASKNTKAELAVFSLDKDWIGPTGIFIDSIKLRSYQLGIIDGKQQSRAEVITSLLNWCKADPECSFNPNSSAWRFYDYITKLSEESK